MVKYQRTNNYSYKECSCSVRSIGVVRALECTDYTALFFSGSPIFQDDTEILHHNGNQAMELLEKNREETSKMCMENLQ